MNIKDINLPKWPALIVVGDNVTEDQAIEINFRTANSYWSTNDKSFLRHVGRTVGADVTDYGSLDIPSELRAKWGSIGLEYLSNSNICSSWIGGLHGWCDWTGRVFTAQYNIGKWPSAEEVYEEWKLIAEAFPFLRLRAQLLGNESGMEDESNEVMVQYSISGGEVTVEPGPQPLLTHPTGPDFSKMFGLLSGGGSTEHLTPDTFSRYYTRFREIRGF